MPSSRVNDNLNDCREKKRKQKSPCKTTVRRSIQSGAQTCRREKERKTYALGKSRLKSGVCNLILDGPCPTDPMTRQTTFAFLLPPFTLWSASPEDAYLCISNTYRQYISPIR
ncbi:hypothetical protein CEXT_639591 [Caerostris extrusa]|uniref:Uncharacterized protein n=1 Tax=Caerostris extrusa TaxID=172846 RepID=A0AAV4MD66_CAEEX|nr:hypothetical protein CEXT_639591 [Caerostris extrusa]